MENWSASTRRRRCHQTPPCWSYPTWDIMAKAGNVMLFLSGQTTCLDCHKVKPGIDVPGLTSVGLVRSARKNRGNVMLSFVSLITSIPAGWRQELLCLFFCSQVAPCLAQYKLKLATAVPVLLLIHEVKGPYSHASLHQLQHTSTGQSWVPVCLFTGLGTVWLAKLNMGTADKRQNWALLCLCCSPLTWEWWGPVRRNTDAMA